MKRYGTFTGGIDLPDEKTITINRPVTAWDSRLDYLLYDRGITPEDSWKILTAEQLRAKLRDGEISVHRGLCESLGHWIEKVLKAKCAMMALNVMEQQPMVTADHRLMADFGPQVITGFKILANACSIGNMVIAVDRRRTPAYQAILSLTDRYSIRNLAPQHKYPIGNDIILAKILRGKDVPAGKTPLANGIAIIDAATCWAIYKWVTAGQKLSARVVTVNQSTHKSPGNYLIPFKTRCLDVCGPIGGTVILNGLMTGTLCREDSLVGPATTAILVKADVDESVCSSCIRCGWCSWHCPARLNVAMLNDDFERGHVERASERGVIACVGCGICSYICPAKLPLMQRMKRLQKIIRFENAR